MNASYQQLIDDHERILAAAKRLLGHFDDDQCEAVVLTNTLDTLAREVHDHVTIEDTVISYDHGVSSGPWLATWQEGQKGVARLRGDWLTFLQKWNIDTIAADTTGFKEAATGLLARLRERIQIETQAFYASALQGGAITLR